MIDNHLNDHLLTFNLFFLFLFQFQPLSHNLPHLQLPLFSNLTSLENLKITDYFLLLLKKKKKKSKTSNPNNLKFICAQLENTWDFNVEQLFAKRCENHRKWWWRGVEGPRAISKSDDFGSRLHSSSLKEDRWWEEIVATEIFVGRDPTQLVQFIRDVPFRCPFLKLAISLALFGQWGWCFSRAICFQGEKFKRFLISREKEKKRRRSSILFVREGRR